VNSPSRDDAPGPSPIHPSPAVDSTPLPGSFGLSADSATTALDGGRVLMGGSPLRLLRVTARASALIAEWESGALVGERRREQVLARRLVASGVFVPRPGPPVHGPPDVTVIIPVRDRPHQLARLLAALDGLRCVVVDDGSADAVRTDQIARQAGADVVVLAANAGPSAARNAGLARADTPLVAFVDSDCIPSAGWLEPLLRHFNDPMVGAVAPRIAPAPIVPPTALSRYEAVRSSLDQGSLPGVVRPLSRISYVPSATLVVRREAAGALLFDPALRGGEDVDLVWRLGAAGWTVRYEPATTVTHDGPTGLMALLRRRAFYGTTAGPLARRHPDNLAPFHMSAWTAGVWGLAAARRPFLSAGTLAASVWLLARRLRGLVDQPVKVAAEIAGSGTARAALPALGGLTRAWSPVLALGLCWRRTRRAAVVALLAPAVGDWMAVKRDLDPVRYTAFHVADDLAYGSGVWLGCLRARTVAPLRPRVAFKARVWSAPSLRAQLGEPAQP
jgi:mycofactocin system glycosyltransferase